MASRVTYEFPARGDLVPVTLHWYDGGMKPPRPPELEDGREWDTNGALYVGDKGKIHDGRLIPESRQREYGKPPQKLERSPGHHMEWILACKGGKPAGSNFPDHAGLLAQVVLLGNVALRPALKEKLLSTKLFWDPRLSRSRICPRPISICTGSIAPAGRCNSPLRSCRLGRV